MGRLLIILLGLIALAVLAFFCANKHSPNIEDDLVKRVQKVLDGNSKNFVKVAIDGRDLILTGVAPEEVARERAGELARGVEGVRIVDNQLTLALVIPDDNEATPVEVVSADNLPESSLDMVPEPNPYFEVKNTQSLDARPAALFPETISPYRTSIIYEDGKIVLSGLVADESSRTWLVTRAKEKFGSNNVDDQMQVVYGAPQGWHMTIESSLINLASLDYGEVSLIDTDLTIRGFASTQQLADRVEAAIAADIDNVYKDIYDIKVGDPIFIAKDLQRLDSLPAMRALEPSVSCQKKFNEILVTERILFDTNKVVINSKSFGLLDRLVTVAKECPKSSIEVGGHTDNRGSKTYNQRLSESRAKAVMDYLKEHDVTSNRFHAKGYGELKPIADNSTGEGLAKNRRIEFKVRENQ